MTRENTEIPAFLSIEIVLWPAIFCILGFVVATAASLYGCTISAQGPKECVLLGVDIGGFLHPLWALGIYVVYAFIWVPIGLVILALVRWVRRNAI